MHKRISWLFQFSEFSCSSIFILKRYIKIYESRNPRLPYFFTHNKYFWSKNETYNKKNHDISYIREREKLILRKKFVKIIVAVIIAVNYFCKTLHPRYLTGFWMCFWFWIYQSSEYAKVMQGCECVWICLNNSWIYLIVSEYAWTYLNVPEYA